MPRSSDRLETLVHLHYEHCLVNQGFVAYLGVILGVQTHSAKYVNKKFPLVKPGY